MKHNVAEMKTQKVYGHALEKNLNGTEMTLGESRNLYLVILAPHQFENSSKLLLLSHLGKNSCRICLQIILLTGFVIEDENTLYNAADVHLKGTQNKLTFKTPR